MLLPFQASDILELKKTTFKLYMAQLMSQQKNI